MTQLIGVLTRPYQGSKTNDFSIHNNKLPQTRKECTGVQKEPDALKNLTPGIRIIAHNTPFDARMLMRCAQ